MEKETMTQSRAEAIMRKATEAFLSALTEPGGEVITEERLAKIRQTVDDLAWDVLRDTYDIVED